VQEVARVKVDVGDLEGKRVMYALSHFLEFAGDVLLDRIDAALVEAYQRKRLTEASLRTVGMELSYLLRMLRLRGFILPRPTRKRGKVTPNRAFTRDELQRFFDACPTRCRTLYALMLATGARQAELVPSPTSSHVALLKSEVNLDERTVTIRCAKARIGTESRERVLPIPEELIAPLRAEMTNTDGHFVLPQFWNSRRDFESIIKRARIAKKDPLGRKVTAHSFRHTYATLMAQAIGHNPFVLKEILGHRQLSTTDRYCHLSAPQVVLPVHIRFDKMGVREGCKVVDMALPRGA